MQFGSGYGAQTVLLPSEADEMVARSQLAKQQSQLGQATLADKIAMSGTQRDSSALALADARTSSLAKTTATDQQLIANAAALATTPDEWDQAMQGLADKGVKEARQWVGRFSEQTKGRVTNAYSAGSPSSALSAMQSDNPTGAGGAQSGLADVAGGAGAGINDGATTGAFDQQLASLPPPAVKALYDKTEAIRAAVQAVAQSPNPSQTWDQQAAQMGHPEWVGKYSPQALQQLTQQTIPLSNYLRGRITREGMGVPDAKIPAEIKDAGGVLYAVDKTDPSNPKTTALTPRGKWVLVGTDPESKMGIYQDSGTGEEKMGTMALAAKPGGAGGRSSVFGQKQQAWLDAHPGDTQGALDFAGGHKTMSAPQARTAAAAQAARDLQAITLGGGTVPDPEAFLKKAEDEHFAETMTSQGTAGAASATPAGATPAKGAAFTAAQQGFEHQFPANPRAQPGAQDKPFYVSTEAQRKGLKVGAYYVGPDGQLRQKKTP